MVNTEPRGLLHKHTQYLNPIQYPALFESSAATLVCAFFISPLLLSFSCSDSTPSKHTGYWTGEWLQLCEWCRINAATHTLTHTHSPCAHLPSCLLSSTVAACVWKQQQLFTGQIWFSISASLGNNDALIPSNKPMAGMPSKPWSERTANHWIVSSTPKRNCLHTGAFWLMNSSQQWRFRDWMPALVLSLIAFSGPGTAVRMSFSKISSTDTGDFPFRRVFVSVLLTFQIFKCRPMCKYWGWGRSVSPLKSIKWS